MADLSVLSYQECLSTICDVFNAGINAVLLDGPPGGGKTTMAKYIQQRLAIKHRFVLKPGHHDVVDFQGCPVPSHEDKRTYFYPSADLLPPSDLQGGCVMVWDEIADAPTPNQNLCCQGIFEGGLHGYKFPENTVHFLTANRVSDRSGANRIVTKLGNRVAWYTLDPTIEELYRHGVEMGWDPQVLSFIKLRGADPINPNDRAKDGRPVPTYFNSFDPSDPAQLVKPVFASSRSIEFASNLVKWVNTYNPGMKDGALLARLAGIVGGPWATAFVPWRTEHAHMPDPDAILRGEKIPFPTKQSVMWTLVTTLVTRVTKSQWKHLAAWLKQGPAEMYIYAVRLSFDTKVAKLQGPDFQTTLQEADVKQALTAK